jgi:HSP20 family molecular chaperone IbpA
VEIETEKVTAELKDGMLAIRLPKSVRSAELQVTSQVA